MARKGEHLSEETKKKLSLAKKGKMSGKQNPFYGKKHSEASKRKMSETHKRLYADGKWKVWSKGLTKDTDVRLLGTSEKRKGQHWSEGSREKIRGRKNHFYGKKHSESSKRKISVALRGRQFSDEHKRKISEALKGRETPWLTGKPMSTEHKKRIGEAHRKLWEDLEYRETQSKIVSKRSKLQWENLDFRKHIQEVMREKWKEEEYREEHSVFMKELWEDENWKRRQMSVMLHGLLKKPTSLELQFIKICQKHDLPFRYVGNGEFYIGSKNPDFIHQDGMKICVEVANLYEKHHSVNYKEERKEYFAQFGWDCIVFMGNKLDETSVLSKLDGVVVYR